MSNALTEIAITDEVTTCEACGRHNLKRTVLLSDGSYFGTDCAAAAIYGSKKYTARVVKAVETRKSIEGMIAMYAAGVAANEALLAAGQTKNRWGVDVAGLLASDRKWLEVEREKLASR
jgi:hypothetical protein